MSINDHFLFDMMSWFSRLAEIDGLVRFSWPCRHFILGTDKFFRRRQAFQGVLEISAFLPELLWLRSLIAP
jgi:hypothetical protein